LNAQTLDYCEGFYCNSKVYDNQPRLKPLEHGGKEETEGIWTRSPSHSLPISW
jgi:hypothetical protein